MNTPAADDYSAIKARMEEIEAERTSAPADEQTAIPEEPEPKPYMGWDIYAPVKI